MKTKLKTIARFASAHWYLTVAILLFVYLSLMFLFSIGNEQPAYTVGFNQIIAHLAIAFIYVAGGWDLRKWREGRKP